MGNAGYSDIPQQEDEIVADDAPFVETVDSNQQEIINNTDESDLIDPRSLPE